jgi:hypothetical protein
MGIWYYMQMETLFIWLGFIGSWFLFAGPIYQAVLELQDQDIEFDRLRAAGAKVPRPAKLSGWFWIIFPVKLYVEYRRNKYQQQHILKLLDRNDIESLVSFRNKSTAWLFVALGGACIASKETYELAEHYELSGQVLLLLIVVMIALSIINLAYRLKRSTKIKNIN